MNNKDRWANDNDSFQNNHGVENAYGVKNVARIYQQSVEKADVISLSLGNGNLGVFMAGTVTNALGIFGVPQQNDWIRFEDAIATLDAETQGILMKMYDTVCAKLTEHLPKDQAEGITRGVSYSLASLIVNYMGAVDRIVELNPDAKIILVGLLNTLDEAIMIMEDNTEVDLGDVMNILIEPLNYFMVAYPVMMQSQGKFPEAEFICMENAEFETVFQNVKNIVPSENPTIRIRYIGNITFNIFSMIFI